MKRALKVAKTLTIATQSTTALTGSSLSLPHPIRIPVITASAVSPRRQVGVYGRSA
jgi:hypothetical protein